MSRLPLLARRASRPGKRARREFLERFFTPRAEQLEKRLLLATDAFPATQATLELTFGDPVTGPTEIIDLSGPTEVFRGDDPVIGLGGLENVPLQIQILDLAGDHPAFGPVLLQLPVSPLFASSGFVEETVNNIDNELESPFFSQLQMFVQVNTPLSDPPLNAVNVQPIILSADLLQIPPGPGEAYQLAGPPVELVDATTLQPFVPGIFVTDVIHILQPVNRPPDPQDVTVDLAENSANGTNVHPVDPNDPDVGDTHTFAIVGGNEEGVFQINPNTGEITVVDNTHLDHEWFPMFHLDIEVTDNGDLSGVSSVWINVTDENDLTVARDDHQFITSEDAFYDSTAPDILKIPAGFDLMRTPPNVGGSTSDFATQTDINIPAGFFGVQNGTPSDPIFLPQGTTLTFVGEPGNVVGFEPSPVKIFENCHENPGGDHLHCIEPLPPAVDLHEADTVIERVQDVVLPDIGDSGTTPIQIVGLSLVGIDPLPVTYGAEPAQAFDIFVGLDGVQAAGQMTLTRTTPTGGTWDSQLPVDFQIVFENQDSNGPMALAPVGGFSIPGDLQLVGGQFDVATSVLPNDTDQDGDSLTIVGVNGTTNLSGFSDKNAPITLDALGNLTYDPTGVAALQALPEGGETTDTFTYSVGDGLLDDVATVTVTVLGVNDPPDPQDVTVDLAENSANGTIVHPVDPNDPDVGDTHTFAIVGGNDMGVFQIGPTGIISVADNTKLDHEWFPMFHLDIEVTDNGGLTGDSTVWINVTDENDLAVARDDHQFITSEDAFYDSTAPDILKIPAGFDLMRTPPDIGGRTSDFATQTDINIPAGFFGFQNGTPSDPMFLPQGTTLTFVGEPGNVVGFEPSPVVIFENCHENPGGDHLHCIEPLPPAVDLHEADTIIERLDDVVLPDIGDSGTTPIQIVGLSLVGIDPLPVTYGAEPSQAFDIFVGLDGAPAAGQMTLTRTTPTGGTWDSQLPVDFQIVFENQDSNGPMALAPVGGFFIPGDLRLVGGEFDVATSVLPNDTDQDGDSLTIEGVNGTTSLSGLSDKNAAITLDALGNLTYDPTGVDALQSLAEGDETTDTFTYSVSDGAVSGVATVTVTVTGVNDPPVASDDSVTTDEDDPTPFQLDASDVDLGADLDFVIDSGPDDGTITAFDPETGIGTYKPSKDFNGQDSFVWHAVDEHDASSNFGNFAIDIAAVNDPPEFAAGPDLIINELDGPQTIVDWATGIRPGPDTAFDESVEQSVNFLLSNDNNALFTSQPAVSSSGTLTFESAPDTTGVAQVTITAMDDGSGVLPNENTSAEQQFTIRVNKGFEVINDADGEILVRTVNDRILVTTAGGTEHDFPARAAHEPILLRILGSANQTDSLNLDFRGMPPGIVTDFEAGDDDGDAVHTTGGGPNLTVTHETPTADGFRGRVTDGNSTLKFLGIKPLTLLEATPEQVTVNLPPVTDHAVLQRLTTGDGQFQLLSPGDTFEQTLVEIPSVMFLLNASDGNDLIELQDDTGQVLDPPVVVHGNEGNDTLNASLFPHLAELFGDEGDDLFQFDTPMFEKINGGDGVDVVELVGGGAVLDVTALADNQLVGVERLDIEGTGRNLLRLSTSSVQTLAGDGGAVDVLSNQDDSVELGSGWRVAGVEVRDNRFFRIVEQTGGDTAIVNVSGPHDWQNPLLSVDVNNSGGATANDALIVINELPRHRFHQDETDRRLFDAKTVDPFPMNFYDVSGDDHVTALDALRVINFLGRINVAPPGGGGQGESLTQGPLIAAQSSSQSDVPQAGWNRERFLTPSVPVDEASEGRPVSDFAPLSAALPVSDQVRDSAESTRVSQPADSLWKEIASVPDLDGLVALLSDTAGLRQSRLAT